MTYDDEKFEDPGPTEDQEEIDPPTLPDLAKSIRAECLLLERRARGLMTHPIFAGSQMFDRQHGEIKAQIMLAVRHLEDARMRLGKVCQYADDGVSCYDKASLTGTKGTVDPSDLTMESVVGATGQAQPKLPSVGVEAALTKPPPSADYGERPI